MKAMAAIQAENSLIEVLQRKRARHALIFQNRLDSAGWISIMVEPLLCINVPVVDGPNDWGIYEQQ